MLRIKQKTTVSCHTTTIMAVGLAASDVMMTDEGIVMVSVLPKCRRECSIVFTMHKNFAARQRKALQDMTNRIAGQISNDPAEAIIRLSTKTGTGHTFFSPAGFDNRKVINPEQKYRIECASADVIKNHPVITKLKGITDKALPSSYEGRFQGNGSPLSFA